MRKLMYTLFFLMTGNTLFAQLGISVFGNLATPGALLSKSTYSSLGGGGGMGLLYRMDLGSFNIDAGFDGQFLVMGSKTYHFGDERDQYYNSALSGNFFVRGIYNRYSLKPYIGLFAGGLGTSIDEQYFMAGEDNKTKVNLLWNGSSSQGLSLGFLYEIQPFIELEVGITYAQGNDGVSYFDFSTASTDGQYVNYQISSAQNYDMLAFKIGLVFFADPNNVSHPSSNSNCCQCNDSGTGLNIFNIWNGNGGASSHGKINGHGKFFK